MTRIKEKRYMDAEDLRRLCASHRWFTRANNAQYAKFLRMSGDDPKNVATKRKNITTSTLYAMALKVIEYSDPETYDILEVTGIMFCLARICTIHFTEEEV